MFKNPFKKDKIKKIEPIDIKNFEFVQYDYGKWVARYYVPTVKNNEGRHIGNPMVHEHVFEAPDRESARVEAMKWLEAKRVAHGG